MSANRVSKLGAWKQARRDRYGAENVCRDGSLKGNTRREFDGRLSYYDEKDDENGGWLPAEYHSNVRPELILLDLRQHPVPYLRTPAHGEDPYDVTSNCNFVDQHMWAFATKEHRSAIVDEHNNPIFDVATRPEQEWPPEEDLNRPMELNGKILLDHEDRPIMDIPELPRVLSSELEGERMEAYRRMMPHIRVDDLLARMPQLITKRGNVRQIYGLTALRNRCSRFRDEHKIAAWDKRGKCARKA